MMELWMKIFITSLFGLLMFTLAIMVSGDYDEVNVWWAFVLAVGWLLSIAGSVVGFVGIIWS